VLEVDLSGQPCGPKAAFASKGYFAHRRNRRGRQLGRVYASLYEEVVVDQLYPGQTTLPQVLQALVSRAAQVLELNRAKRSHTILRIDGMAAVAMMSTGYLNKAISSRPRSTAVNAPVC